MIEIRNFHHATARKGANSIQNNKELGEYWNTCEANNQGWELIDLATPSIEIQVTSVQKASKHSCSIQ